MTESTMATITFFTKSCCPLCDSAWFVVRKLGDRLDVTIERLDITDRGNESWFALYANDIPVIHLNGVEVMKHRVNEGRLRQLIEGA